MDLAQIQSLVAEDMQAVNDLIRLRLASHVVLINQLSAYIVNSGGKRLRPLLVLLTARAFDYQERHHVSLAAVVELIHTATLLHDDVVDGSALRRGKATANACWGNEASVLVGDFLYSRAFEIVVEAAEARNIRVMEILAHATNTIAEGEVMQLLNVHDPETSEARYLEVIQYKTAKLFEAASQLGAVLGGIDSALEQGMAAYGRHLGIAFQLIDDVLDYRAEPAQTGKNLGDDLAEGKPTLPLIYALKTATAHQAQMIRRAIETGGLEDIDRILEVIESSGAIAYTETYARQQARIAIDSLAGLDGSVYKDALIALAHFVVQRTF